MSVCLYQRKFKTSLLKLVYPKLEHLIYVAKTLSTKVYCLFVFIFLHLLVFYVMILFCMFYAPVFLVFDKLKKKNGIYSNMNIVTKHNLISTVIVMRCSPLHASQLVGKMIQVNPSKTKKVVICIFTC